MHSPKALTDQDLPSTYASIEALTRLSRHERETGLDLQHCLPTIWIVVENHLVLVQSGALEQQWPMTTSRRGRDWQLTITSPGGRSWAAEGPDLFKALRALRRVLDPLGIRLGVNGARRDAWASGMQCDMGEGRVVYLLTKGQTGRPEQVSTLGPTPVSHIGTVDDQDQQHEQWLRSRRAVN
jgi:hypothetical protein